MFKVGFLGNWGTAFEILKILQERKDNSVEFVLTQIDETKNNDKWFNIVYQYSIDNYLNVYNQKLFRKNDKKTLDLIKYNNVDLLVSVAYPYLISKKIIDYMNRKEGIVNIHGSLLPKYRGLAPVPWAIINKEKYIGISLHYIDEGCDTGDIIDQEKILNKKEYSIDKITDKLKEKSKIMFTKFLNKLVEGQEIFAYKQNHKKASYAPRFNDEELKLDFNYSLEDIEIFLKATKKYSIYFIYNNMKLYIDSVYITNEFSNKNPNTILKYDRNNKITISSQSNNIVVKYINESKDLFKVGEKVNE